MFCKKCGKESSGNQKFCTGCGTAFGITTNDTTKPDESAQHQSHHQDSKFNPGQIIGILVLVAFIGWGIYYSVDDTAIETNNTAQEAYQSGGDADQVIAQLRQASVDAVTDSTKLTTKTNLAYVYSSEGKNDLALSTFKEALTFASKGSFDYYLISGEIALLEGKPNSALIAYNKAYEMSPNEFQINNALNLFYLDVADGWPQYVNYPKALTYALKAQELQPSEITKQNLAIAYFFNENYSQTISLLSSSNVSTQPYLAYWLGLAYAYDEQPANAKYYLKIAIDGGVEVPQEVIDYMYTN